MLVGLDISAWIAPFRLVDSASVREILLVHRMFFHRRLCLFLFEGFSPQVAAPNLEKSENEKKERQNLKNAVWESPFGRSNVLFFIFLF